MNKAIDLLKSEIEIYDQYYCLATSQALKTVSNELDRLQKENEELKIDNNKQWKERCRLSFELDDSIPKSVIQDKIDELVKNKNQLDEINRTFRLYTVYDSYDLQANVLQELLNKEE